MAVRQRFSSDRLPELSTAEEAKAKIAAAQRVVILFTCNFPRGASMAHTFNNCRGIYENRYNVYCYQASIHKAEPDFITEFTVDKNKLPTFIFFRDGKPLDRFEDADQPDPDAASIPEEVKDHNEYRLRKYLDRLCGITG